MQGLALPAEVWEQTVLPARVPSYQPRWLDEWVAGGAGVWVAQEGGLLAFLGREMLPQLLFPLWIEAATRKNIFSVRQI